MGYELHLNDWPPYLRGFKRLKGIYVGGCIIGHDARFYRTEDNKKIAFAHAHTKGKHYGWICVPYRTRLRSKYLMLHELAHILCPKKGHKRKWRKTLKRLGGTLKPYKLVGSTLKTKDHRSLGNKLYDWFTRNSKS